MVEWKEHLQRAVDQLGSQPKLAKAMGCSQSKISWLLTTAAEISADDALAIQRATEGKITASDLRPDLADLMKQTEAAGMAAAEQAAE